MPRQKSSVQIAVFGLTSPAFSNGGPLAPKHSYDGGNVSPPLDWDAAPEDTLSFALLCEDPDAGATPWLHWMIFNIAPFTTKLWEGVPRSPRLPRGPIQGRNDFGDVGYGGPQPPSGTHRYFFRLYALDTMLDLDETATRDDLHRAMAGHMVGEVEIMGTFAAPAR